MEHFLRHMPLFVEVARNKSFTLAAEVLEMPISTLSRRISTLEKNLGLPLLRRNSRNVELTDSGKSFYKRCAFIVADAKEACDAITQNISKPSGWVRFSIPGDVYMSFFEESLATFAKIWPEIHLDIRFTESWDDLLPEPYDLGLRVGELADSNLKARRLGSGEPWICAAPSLMEEYATPTHPDDLPNIPCITAHGFKIWEMTNKAGEMISVSLTPVHTFNNISATQSFIVAGLGIGALPGTLAEQCINQGLLVRILPDWKLPSINAYLVMPTTPVPLRVRLLIDYLVQDNPRFARH